MGLQVINGGEESVRGQPTGQRGGIEEGAVELFGSRPDDAVQPDRVGAAPV